MAAKLPLFKYFLVPYILISFENILVCILHASEYHTLITGECAAWKYVKCLLICKLDAAIT